MMVISRCKIENGERHVTREVALSARNRYLLKITSEGL